MTSSAPPDGWTVCCVPFCRRRTGRTKEEWICGKHWALVDSLLRRYWRRQMKKLHARWFLADERLQTRKAELMADHGEGFVPPWSDVLWSLFRIEERARRRWWRAHNTIWNRIKRQAITRAGEGVI